MKILVTGGTGFSGKALVSKLINESHDVVALDYKDGYKSKELQDLGAQIVIGSVADRDVVERCVKGMDVVFHLAAAFRELNVPKQHYSDVNIRGTENVLEASMSNGVKKFIYCSTCGVHGNIDNPPGDETAPIKPADYYQRTKYEAEPIVKRYAEKGLKSTILRPAAIYGPGDPERFKMIFQRVKKGTFPIFGDGKTLYHPLYIDNFVDALILSMDEGKGNGQEYLIADDEFLEIRTLVNKVANVLDSDLKMPQFPILPLVIAGHLCEKICKPFKIAPPIFPRRVDWYRQNRAFKIDKAKKDLGYSPKIGIDEGLKRTAEWYHQENLI